VDTTDAGQDCQREILRSIQIFERGWDGAPATLIKNPHDRIQFALAIGAGGACSKVETSSLLSVCEGMTAMEKTSTHGDGS